MINKIFQIGFNKCGTTSIDSLFNKYTNLQSIHWHHGILAKSIYTNLISNLPLISEQYSNISVFTDMECGYNLTNNPQWIFAYEYYKVLDIQYPNSKFILNIRDINNWINSRLNHLCEWDLDKNNRPIKLIKPIYYWETQLKFYNCKNRIYLIDVWKKHWYNHINNVLNYFHNRSKDLLVLDIEKDSFEKIKQFFHTINFDTNNLPNANKTKVGS